MAFDFPLPTAMSCLYLAGSAQAMRDGHAHGHLRRRFTSSRRIGVDAGSSCGSTLEGNVWEQLMDSFVDAPAPPIRFGTGWAHTPQPFVAPAALAGPVAGPMPAPPIACDSLDDTPIDTSGPAQAVANGGSQVVMLFRELPWQMGYHGTADRNVAVASAIPTGTGPLSQVDRFEEAPKSPTTLLPGCSSGAACKETPALSPSNVIATLRSMQRAADNPTVCIPASAIFGFLLWPILLPVLTVAIGWGARRWFRYDSALLHVARARLRLGEFHIKHPPVVGVRRARRVGVEALLRWDSEKYGASGPRTLCRSWSAAVGWVR